MLKPERILKELNRARGIKGSKQSTSAGTPVIKGRLGRMCPSMEGNGKPSSLGCGEGEVLSHV